MAQVTKHTNGGLPPVEHEYEPKSEDMDAEHEIDDAVNDRPKKKRRMIRIPDKKYECPHENCGKCYSRAEHLSRHQLNRKCTLTRGHLMSKQRHESNA